MAIGAEIGADKGASGCDVAAVVGAHTALLQELELASVADAHHDDDSDCYAGSDCCLGPDSDPASDSERLFSSGGVSCSCFCLRGRADHDAAADSDCSSLQCEPARWFSDLETRSDSSESDSESESCSNLAVALGPNPSGSLSPLRSLSLSAR
eukprot:1387633-Rhodomonas_salina.3